MTKFRVLLLAALIAPAALLAALQSAPAQESMSFRPVPPESVAILERAGKAPKVRISDGKSDVKVQLDQSGVTVTTPAPPAPPEAPRPAPRETTAEIVRFGGDIEVARDQAVDGDVVSFGGDIRVDGVVHGTVTAMGGNVTLTSTAVVDEDVVCLGGTLREQPGSIVKGRRVTGPVSGHRRLWFPMFNILGTGFKIATHLFWMLIMLGVAYLIVKLAPGRTGAALQTLHEEAGMSFLIGLLLLGLIVPSVIVLAVVIAILCITIIGIPLAAAVGVGYVAFFIVAYFWGVIVGYALLGELLVHRFRGGAATLAQAAIWGVIALHGMRIVGDFFHVVPVFGFVGGLLTFLSIAISSVLAVFGAGALVRGEYRRRTVQTWWTNVRGRGATPPREDDVPPPPPPAPEPPEPPAPPSNPYAAPPTA